MEEIFRPVPGFEDAYAVSSKGIIVSLARKIGNRRVKQMALAPKDNGQGYLSVVLCKNGSRSRQYVHRIVASVFIENKEAKQFVNHLDGNPRNNCVENLEWATHPENIQHAYDNGLSANVGSEHWLATGVVDNQLGQSFPTIKSWCRARGISYSTGRNLLNGSNKSRKIDLSAIMLKKKEQQK